MNKILAFALALLLPLGAFAQDAALGKIEKALEKVDAMSASFTRTRLIKASGKETKSTGAFYFAAPSSLSMLYDDGEKLVISGDRLSMVRGGRPSTFDTSKNAMMRSLSSTLLGCVRGRAKEVAEANDATVSVKETADGWLVTLAAKQALPRGYSMIALLYRKSDCMLVKMVMEEFTGIRTTYDMSGVDKGWKADDSKFKI